MPLPTSIADLSTTAASNYPAGSDSPSVLDDVQRAHASYIATLRDTLGLTTGTIVPATARSNIGAAADATQGLTLLSTSTVSSAVAAVDFTSFINASYTSYKIIGTGVIPVTTTTDLWFRVSEDNGSTFKAGASDYTWMFTFAKDNNTSGGLGSATAVAQITLAVGIGNSAATLGGGCDFELTVFAPSNTTQRKRFAGPLVYTDNGGIGVGQTNSGIYRGTTNAINGLRFLFSSGNIAGGTFKLYGVK